MTGEMTRSEELTELIEEARNIAARAHAPYSRFFVGAAVLTEDGTIYRGCNVENASYGLTICAERSAIFGAVAGHGAENLSIKAIAVATASGDPAAPCGACRQVIYEFNPDTEVIFTSETGVEVMSARELLPHGFRLE